VILPAHSLDTAQNPAWFALWTRSRVERQVEVQLESRGIEGFAALAAVERQWSDRKKRIRTALFPGYVFVRIPGSELVRALELPGVAGVVRMAGRPAPIPDAEIAAVQALVHGVDETGALPEIVDPFEPGDPVRIIDGPFRGLVGVVLRSDDGRSDEGEPRVAVRIPAIQQARAIRISRGMVARVTAPSLPESAESPRPNARVISTR
jgi:transcription termination/antitermination protein NusG